MNSLEMSFSYSTKGTSQSKPVAILHVVSLEFLENPAAIGRDIIGLEW